ncbi:MAG: hypothetical protein QNL53_00075 [Microbacteriaceae bacterium]
MAEDFAGGVVDEREDPFASIFFSDSEVMYFPSPTEGDFPSGVEPVDADLVVGGVGQGLGAWL